MPPKAAPPRFRARNPKKALWIQVRWVGGSEGYWSIESRGAEIRRSGLSCLGDLLFYLNGQ